MTVTGTYTYLILPKQGDETDTFDLVFGRTGLVVDVPKTRVETFFCPYYQKERREKHLSDGTTSISPTISPLLWRWRFAHTSSCNLLICAVHVCVSRTFKILASNLNRQYSYSSLLTA